MHLLMSAPLQPSKSPGGIGCSLAAQLNATQIRLLTSPLCVCTLLLTFTSSTTQLANGSSSASSTMKACHAGQAANECVPALHSTVSVQSRPPRAHLHLPPQGQATAGAPNRPGRNTRRLLAAALLVYRCASTEPPCMF
jgi:hypothetical protein